MTTTLCKMADNEIRSLSQQAPCLTKEMEETNDRARLGAQLYFGWFTLLLTVDGFATGWLFTRDGAMPLFARWVLCVFIGMDLLGTIATFRIREHLFASDRRLREVIAKLPRHRAIEGIVPQSPVPLGEIKTALGFTGAALVVLSLFWSIVAIFPSRFAVS